MANYKILGMCSTENKYSMPTKTRHKKMIYTSDLYERTWLSSDTHQHRRKKIPRFLMIGVTPFPSCLELALLLNVHRRKLCQARGVIVSLSLKCRGLPSFKRRYSLYKKCREHFSPFLHAVLLPSQTQRAYLSQTLTKVLVVFSFQSWCRLYPPWPGS